MIYVVQNCGRCVSGQHKWYSFGIFFFYMKMYAHVIGVIQCYEVGSL